MVDEVLYTGNARVDYIDIRNGMTPLLYAIQGRHLDIVKLLFREGASRYLADFKCVTPLMMAASTGMVQLVEAVGGVYTPSIDDQDENGWTALHWAVFANSPVVIDYLLEVLVANRNVRDVDKKKPYHLASFLNYGDCEAILIDSKMKMAIATGDVD